MRKPGEFGFGAVTLSRRSAGVLHIAATTVVVLTQFIGAADAQTPHHPHYATPTDKLPATLSEAAFHPIMLTGAAFSDDPIIGHPMEMSVASGVLWVGDGSGNPFLHVINLASSKVETSFGRRREGPGDFQYIMLFSPRRGDTGAIWVDDGNLRRLTRVAATGPRPDPRVIGGFGLTGQGAERNPVVLRMFWLDAVRLVLIGSADTNRIMFADSMGRITSVHRGVLLGTDRQPMALRMTLSEGVIPCVRPGADRFAVAYSTASRIDLYDADGGSLGRMRVPLDPSPDGDWGQDATGKWHAPLPRWYYRDCAATQDRLYTLFAGRLQTAGPAGSKKWDAQFVHVFDWSGRLLAVFQLDQLAETIAVDGDSILYAGGDAIEGVVRYHIPPLGGVATGH